MGARPRHRKALAGDSYPVRDKPPVAAFVRERRKANRLSQRQLAELAGVGPRAVWDLERGKPTVRMDVANAILKVFGKELGVADAPRDEVSEP